MRKLFVLLLATISVQFAVAQKLEKTTLMWCGQPSESMVKASCLGQVLSVSTDSQELTVTGFKLGFSYTSNQYYTKNFEKTNVISQDVIDKIRSAESDEVKLYFDEVQCQGKDGRIYVVSGSFIVSRK